jgi:phosphoribosyl-AMP cyclohydrolase
MTISNSNLQSKNLKQQINEISAPPDSSGINLDANRGVSVNPVNQGNLSDREKAQLIEQTISQLKFNDQGLIPAIAQDASDGTVLMIAWMNAESVGLSIQTGEVHYWSRSRQELWHKGATSGHIQKIQAMYYDCDADALLIKIEQVGNVACHTGARSCFFNQVI